jgi:hypothetical protein
MMELLAGPNTVARVGADSRSSKPWSNAGAFWDDDLGFGSITSNLFGYGPNYFVTQLDGTCGVRGNSSGSIVLDVSDQGEWALYNVTSDPVSGDLVGLLCGFDKQSGVYADKLIVRSAGIMAAGFFAPQIRAVDRLVSIWGTQVKKRAIDGSDSAWVLEANLTAGPDSTLYVGTPTVSRTTDPAIVCIIYQDGGILFYDVVAKQQVIRPVARIGSNVGAWYSPKFDIYTSYTTADSDWEVTVWANAVRPDSLSDPVAAPSLVQGKVSRVLVRLLGADGEPCEGELVAWSITGGAGALTSTQSTTDADGYAYIGYIAPVSAGTSPTIQASVEF